MAKKRKKIIQNLIFPEHTDTTPSITSTTVPPKISTPESAPLILLRKNENKFAQHYKSLIAKGWVLTQIKGNAYYMERK